MTIRPPLKNTRLYATTVSAVRGARTSSSIGTDEAAAAHVRQKAARIPRAKRQPSAKTLVAATIVVAAVLFAGSSRIAVAQPQPEEGRPRLVLNTFGPASRTRSVAFSNDSARLFAAGFDKTVHVWDVGWNNQQGVNGPDKATPIRTLRWEVARANRGLINVMALSPNGERLAIAGQSARGANGDIILIDIDRYEVEGSLPPVRDEATHLPGHTQSVTSLNFSPDGRRLVSAGFDGAVWLWTEQPGQRGNWAPTQIRPPRGSKLFERQPALFLSNDLMVIAEATDPNAMNRWRLVLYSVAGEVRQLQVLPQIHEGRVSALARSTDGRLWASADTAGHLFLWTPGPQPAPRVLRFHKREPSSLAFGPDGRLLAVANFLDERSESVVELWDTASGALADQALISRTEHTNAVTISGDGQFLATHADDTQDVRVFRLAGPDGTLLAKPLSSQPPVRLHSRAQRVTHVAFKRPQAVQLPAAPPAYEIGFSTAPDRQIYSDFLLSQPDLHRLEQPALPDGYIGPGTFAGGWQAVPAANGSEVRLLLNGAEAGRIRLNEKRQGEFEGHSCIVPDAQGRPFAVAIGTTNQNGIYVYRLPTAGRPAKLLRYFRDHNGEVLSVGVSHDGRFLVSGAEDQTIKVWSLAGLQAESPTFPHQSAWGADFRLENGRLVVHDVLPMGIAFGRELRNGDVITKLTTAAQGDLFDPAQIKAVLDRHPLWETVLFTVDRGGRQIALKPTVPGWEPLMTLLVDAQGEWALFTPEGYYDASIAEGHRLFGWQINRGRNFTPRFLEAASLQKDFERPDLFQGIFRTGSVFDALTAGNEPIPANFNENIAAKAATVPDIKIVEPVATRQFGPGEQITLKAEFTTPANTDPDTFAVRATHGGRSAGEAQQVQDEAVGGGRTKRTLTFTTTAADRLNRFTASIAEKDKPIVRAVQNQDTRANRAQPADPKTEQPPKLHVLALASNHYDEAYWPTLKYPVDDVKAVVKSLYEEERESGLYEFDQELTLFNELITPGNVDTYIAQIQRDLNPVGPKDVVLVYLSGHGKAIDGEYYYIPPMETTDNEQVKQRAISWRQLEKLSSFRCHVIWMIDTCQSGILADSKATVRSVAETGNLVVAATSGTDEAFEGEQYVDNNGNPHGAFTAFVLKGLDGEADGATRKGAVSQAEGVVNVGELLAYVKQTVYRATQRNQEPCFTPTDLLDVMEVRLSKK